MGTPAKNENQIAKYTPRLYRKFAPFRFFPGKSHSRNSPCIGAPDSATWAFFNDCFDVFFSKEIPMPSLFALPVFRFFSLITFCPAKLSFCSCG